MKHKKPRRPKHRISKEVSRINREEQLKAGVNLTTKVVPDKKKYSRKRKDNDLPIFGQE